MHSFDASTLNFGEVVQHTSPLNKHYWHFLIPPSGPASGAGISLASIAYMYKAKNSIVQNSVVTFLYLLLECKVKETKKLAIKVLIHKH